MTGRTADLGEAVGNDPTGIFFFLFLFRLDSLNSFKTGVSIDIHLQHKVNTFVAATIGGCPTVAFGRVAGRSTGPGIIVRDVLTGLHLCHA
jgi:hypothetical protein